jgi:soluble lytic murein transglycosylase-like protein
MQSPEFQLHSPKPKRPSGDVKRVDVCFCAEKDGLPMNRLILTALAAASPLVVFSHAAIANDNPLAFYSLPKEPAAIPAAASARSKRVDRAVERGADGPAAADIARIAEQMGVPRGLALSVCRVETKCRYGLVGRAGERGPMQIKLQTARGLGYTGDAAGLNGHTGAYWGMKHLQVAYQKCGNARGAARLHNAGLASSCGGSGYASRVVAGL